MFYTILINKTEVWILLYVCVQLKNLSNLSQTQNALKFSLTVKYSVPYF